MWDASAVTFWHLGLIGRHYSSLRKSTEILLVFSGQKKNKIENVPKRDPYALLYVNINTKAIVIT